MINSTKRPFIVVILALLMAIQSSLAAALFVLTFYVSPESTLQIIGDPFVIAEERIAILSVFAVWAAFSLMVTRGLWRGNSIARHASFAYLIIIALLVVYARQALLDSLLVALAIGALAWYFYAKPNVQIFFSRDSSTTSHCQAQP